MSRHQALLIIVAFASYSCLLMAVAAVATPRFAARVGQRCNLCHVSPTGGGMRNSFGGQCFAQTEMAIHKTPLAEIENFDPLVSRSISIGADLRTIYIHDSRARQSTFFQMQGTLHVCAQLHERTSLVLSKGMYSGSEAYGVAYMLPYHGYLRLGRFQPAYGWRFDDHTSFVRERLLWRPGEYDTGLEIGFLPHNVSLTIGVFNGTSLTMDNDRGKAIAGRLELRRHVGPSGVALGASYYHNDQQQSKTTRLYGPFYYVTLGPLIYLGETDWLISAATDADITTLATSHELTLLLGQGIWAKMQYDFHDHDIKRKTGSLSRLGLGFQVFPTGFVEFAPTIRIYGKTNSAGKNDRYVTFDGQVHLFF